jgi:hypothetical protein
MDLKETEARDDCAGEDQQQFNTLTDWPTDRECEGVAAMCAAVSPSSEEGNQ